MFFQYINFDDNGQIKCIEQTIAKIKNKEINTISKKKKKTKLHIEQIISQVINNFDQHINDILTQPLCCYILSDYESTYNKNNLVCKCFRLCFLAIEHNDIYTNRNNLLRSSKKYSDRRIFICNLIEKVPGKNKPSYKYFIQTSFDQRFEICTCIFKYTFYLTDYILRYLRTFVEYKINKEI